MPPNKKNLSDASAKHEIFYREGLDHFQSGRFQIAIQSLNDAISFNPNFAKAYSLMGRAYLNIPGHHLEARESFMRSINANPCDAESYFLLGLTLMSQRAWPEALDALNLAIHYNPDYAQAYSNRGVCYSKLGQSDLALSDFEKAIKLKPDSVDAYSNKGHLLLNLGLKKESAEILEEAICLDPNHTNAVLNLSTAYLALNQYENAIKLLEGAKKEGVNNSGVYQNLGLAYALTSRARLAFDNYSKCVELEPNNFLIHSNRLLCMLEVPEFDRSQIFNEHINFSRHVNEYLSQVLDFHRKPFINKIEIKRKIKIGFVSGDLRDHAVSYYMEPVFKGLNRDAFEIYAYHTCPPSMEDATTTRLTKYFSKWNQVFGHSDQDLYDLIYSDQIDILVDLSGHTGFNRLVVFAMKPAPIQISWIGYPETTGLDQIDYTIFPNSAARGENEPYYSEKIIYIPTPFVFKPYEPSPRVNELPALKNGHLTFGIFGNTRKFSDQSYQIWSRVLIENPMARVLIVGVDNDLTRDLVIQKFQAHGIAAERLVINGFLPMPQFLTLMGEVDICLDTYPYSGGTTTNHAVWMGVPTMTLYGQTAASRQSAGIMQQYNLGEFSCSTIDEYCSKIHYWSDHLEALASLRGNIRGNIAKSSPIRAEYPLLGLEKALNEIWKKYCKGGPADSFDVSVG